MTVSPAKKMPTREEALERFVYSVSHDFHGPNNEAPTWAEGYPKQWGDEDECIILQIQQSEAGIWNRTFRRYGSAVTSDGKLLAAMDDKGTLIYDLQTKELRQRIRDGEHPIRSLWFPAAQESSGYVLICSREDPRGLDGTIELYQLDQYGRLVDEDAPLDTRGLAAKAFTSIRKDLVETYGWTDGSIEPLDLVREFENVLDLAEKRHATKNKIIIQGSATGFGSTPFDTSGRFMLLRRNNSTTQRGMRPPEKLPHIIVYDLVGKKEVFTLAGHSDTIVWSAYSPDNSKIATVSWDGSARVHSSATGKLNWNTNVGEGQAWSASFSPDSRYIVVSTGKGRIITVHSSEDGKIVGRLNDLEINDWVRNLIWRPTDKHSIALSHRKSVYIWRPFEESGAQVEQIFAIDDRAGDGFRGIGALQVDWLDDGKKLIVVCNDGSLEIWDVETNRKWRMLKPQGLVVGSNLEKRHLVQGADGKKTLLSTDGDGVVRFWPLI